MFTNLHSLAFFCGVGAFYAQQTEQQNLLLGFGVLAFILVLVQSSLDSARRDRWQFEDSMHNRIDEVDRNLREDIREIRTNIRECNCK
jgi:hypothetical protein